MFMWCSSRSSICNCPALQRGTDQIDLPGEPLGPSAAACIQTCRRERHRSSRRDPFETWEQRLGAVCSVPPPELDQRASVPSGTKRLWVGFWLLHTLVVMSLAPGKGDPLLFVDVQNPAYAHLQHGAAPIWRTQVQKRHRASKRV
jgi:hypothetical protein